MADLSDIKSRKELEDVVDRLNTSLQFEHIHLELSSNSRMDDLVMFLHKNFYPDEPLRKSLGHGFEEVKNLLTIRLKENLSLLFISNSTDEIIACITMATARRGNNDDVISITNTNEKVSKIIGFLESKSDKMNVFKRFNVDIAVELIHLSTHKDHRGNGIATKLINAALMFCKEIGLNPVCVKADATTKYSQNILEKFEFEELHTLRYDEYKIDGKIVFNNTDNNESTKCYAKQL